MDTIEDKIIKLEDGKYYYVTKELTNEDVIYVYLTDIKEPLNFCIRKKDETKENLIGLSDEDEYNKAIVLFKNNIN